MIFAVLQAARFFRPKQLTWQKKQKNELQTAFAANVVEFASDIRK